MNDRNSNDNENDASGIHLDQLSKRQLVDELLKTAIRWNGLDPVSHIDEHRMGDILDRLQRCRMLEAERHWCAMSVLWLNEARRNPEVELREAWLDVLHDWQVFLQEYDLLPDELPPSR